MLFNSFEFLIFFPVVTAIYFLLPHRFRWLHLLAASCYFYVASVPKYLLVIGAIILVDYFAAIYLEKAAGQKKQRLFIFTIVFNILVLCVFKYYYFFVLDINALMASFQYSSFSLPLILLFPIGLSFQTFQSLSYVFEVNRGTVKAEKHLGIYALYILFFPKLVAGPIERPQKLLPQFREPRRFDPNNVLVGLKIMLWGFIKKLVIADRLAIFVAEVYKDPAQTGSVNLWLAVLIFFPVQLYCDFSGYSSIAVGAARVLGFHLTENFKRPFASVTASEFWNRWHISLSTWLRDYIYQPTVIELRNWGKAAVVTGLFITFFVSGLWHGSGLNFIVYGIFQGSIIILEFLLGIKAVKLSKTVFGRIRGVITTYILWALTLIFFRSANLQQSLLVLKKMFWANDFSFISSGQIPAFTFIASAILIVGVLAVETTRFEKFLYQRQTVKKEMVFGSGLLAVLLAFGVFHNVSFIYFKF